MRSMRVAERALLKKAPISPRQYVCRTCLAQASQQFHTSTCRSKENDQTWYSRLKDSIFGSSERKKVKSPERSITKANKPLTPYKDVVDRRTGKKYQIARAVDASTTKDYVPATRWDGLERMGSGQWIKERADSGAQYVGYMPASGTLSSAITNDLWQELFCHTAAEALENYDKGSNPMDICRNARRKYQGTTTSGMLVSKNGVAVFEHTDVPESSQILSKYTGESSSNQKTETREKRNSREIVRTNAQDTWRNVSFPTSLVKFAVIKRIMQLTGHRIPDRSISTSTTLGALFDVFSTRDKPARLANSLASDRLDLDLPNVKVFATKRTPMQREEEIGRRKLILEELESRGLIIPRDVEGRRQENVATQ